jgi:hypothetical protein
MTTRALSLLKLHEKILIMAAGIAFACPTSGYAIAPRSQVAGAKKPTYEIVSVHSCKPGNGISIRTLSDGYSRCTTIWGLIYSEFDVRPDDPIPGLLRHSMSKPRWAMRSSHH